MWEKVSNELNSFPKQGPIYIKTKSLNQYPNIEAQPSDEIQPLESYENSTVVFDNMLLSKQAINTDWFSTRWRQPNIDVYYTYESQFDLPKTPSVKFLV